ncbi:MAG: hypothetical protein ACRC2T_08610 [Thermoguttaceae bacterium]
MRKNPVLPFILFLTIAIVTVLLQTQRIVAAETAELQTPKLFATLPDFCPTPDGMAVGRDGTLYVACPNYAYQTKPACVIKVDREGKTTKWFDVPVLEKTGLACPMGICFGPDGDLYICDNQGWKGTEEGAFEGRILRVRVGKDGELKTTVIAEKMEHPNGIRFKNGALYVTQSMMSNEKDPSGLLVSGVYCFDPNTKKPVQLKNTREDETLLFSVLTNNKDCQYGLDGIDFDRNGNMYVGNFGDGTILKSKKLSNGTFDKPFVWAEDLSQMRTTDGIFFAPNGKLYVADFSENAVAEVTPSKEKGEDKGIVRRIAKSPDSNGANGELDQPGEPIFAYGKLIVSCFDCVTGPDKVDTGHDEPFTLTSLEIPVPTRNNRPNRIR